MLFLLQIYTFKIKNKKSEKYIQLSKNNQIDDFSTKKADKNYINFTINGNQHVGTENNILTTGKYDHFKIIKDVSGYFRILNNNGCWEVLGDSVEIRDCRKDDSQLFEFEGDCLHCEGSRNEPKVNPDQFKSKFLDAITSKLPVNMAAIDKYRKSNGLQPIYEPEDDTNIDDDFKPPVKMEKSGSFWSEGMFDDEINIPRIKPFKEYLKEYTPHYNSYEPKFNNKDENLNKKLHFDENKPNKNYDEPEMNYDEQDRNYDKQDRNFDEQDENYYKPEMNYDQQNRNYDDQNINNDNIIEHNNNNNENIDNKTIKNTTQIILPLYNTGYSVDKPIVLDIDAGKSINEQDNNELYF